MCPALAGVYAALRVAHYRGEEGLEKTARMIIYQDFDRAYRWRLRSGKRVTIAASESGHRKKSSFTQELKDWVLEYPEVLVRDATVRNSQQQPLTEWLASQTS
jgi:hypothetical protein